ncbi:putative cytochrome c biosynthesis protein [Bienertia sinuspersici]
MNRFIIRYFRVFSLHSLTNKKQPPAFSAAPAFWCILLSLLGFLFYHIPNNLSNYNVLTTNAPFFYQISGTWSNHEGSIIMVSDPKFLWIPSLLPGSIQKTPFYLFLVTNKKVEFFTNPSCTLSSFYELLLILNFVRKGAGLLTSQLFFTRCFTLKGR